MSDNKKICSKCVYWEVIKESGLMDEQDKMGTCVRFPPKPLINSKDDIRSVMPLTFEFDRCGEYTNETP